MPPEADDGSPAGRSDNPKTPACAVSATACAAMLRSFVGFVGEPQGGDEARQDDLLLSALGQRRVRFYALGRQDGHSFGSDDSVESVETVFHPARFDDDDQFGGVKLVVCG